MNQYSNKYKTQDYIDKCREFNVTFVGTQRDKHKGVIISFICPVHPDKGKQAKDWSHFKNLKHGCKYCAGKRDTKDAQELVKNPNIKFISEYRGVEKPIRCICEKCGTEWTSRSPKDLFRRECGCPTCSKEIRASHKRKSQEAFIKDVYNVNPNIEVIGEYKGAHKLVKCHCKIHDYEWESYASNLLNKSAGCPKCNMSLGENMVVEFMQKYNIPYTRQKTFSGCSDRKPLKFDVFDEENKIAIEFQGEQHYTPIDFSGKGIEFAVSEFNELKKRDNIKINYCKENGITLIAIPYYERNNVEAYLFNNVDKYKERYKV